MTSIIHKNSGVAGKQPQPADIERGELAVNLTDKKLFTKDQTDAIVQLGGGGVFDDLADVTINDDTTVTGITLGAVADANVGKWQVELTGGPGARAWAVSGGGDRPDCGDSDNRQRRQGLRHWHRDDPG